MREWDKKTIQPENKNSSHTFQIDVKNGSYLEETDRYKLDPDSFPNNSDVFICTCAEEEYFSYQEGFLIPDEIPADANLDDDMWF